MATSYAVLGYLGETYLPCLIPADPSLQEGVGHRKALRVARRRCQHSAIPGCRRALPFFHGNAIPSSLQASSVAHQQRSNQTTGRDHGQNSPEQLNDEHTHCRPLMHASHFRYPPPSLNNFSNSSASVVVSTPSARPWDPAIHRTLYHRAPPDIFRDVWLLRPSPPPVENDNHRRPSPRQHGPPPPLLLLVLGHHFGPLVAPTHPLDSRRRGRPSHLQPWVSATSPTSAVWHRCHYARQ
jgi:hypothetical protein